MKDEVVVITGGSNVFAAGADLKEMASSSAVDMLTANRIALWDRVRRINKPLIAAVAGYALGGGCELAMLCDVVIAAENARFGQPEINVGLIPGAGGTQRLTRSVHCGCGRREVVARLAHGGDSPEPREVSSRHQLELGDEGEDVTEITSDCNNVVRASHRLVVKIRGRVTGDEGVDGTLGGRRGCRRRRGR